jgi:hypothetical protein
VQGTVIHTAAQATNPPRRTRRWRRIVAGAAAGVALVAVAAAVIGRVTFERRIAGEVDDLFAARSDAQPRIMTEADLESLPEPVQRWLRASGVVGVERPTAVRLKQEGEFRLGEDRGWMPFTAEQYYTTDPPGFVWVASFEMAPLLTVSGRDRYMDGTGAIDMRILSLVPVARKSGGGLNQGALLRYLNETMWFPAAVVSPYITWETIDATSARATMSYGGVTASATFIFDEEDRLINMVAERYNDAKDRIELWSTPVTDYGEFEGIRMAVQGEGVWNYETGDFPYIRLRITEVQYNRPARY